MAESIVCSRAKVFVVSLSALSRFALQLGCRSYSLAISQGTYYSTFSGYIHRLRGYHGLGEDTYYHTPGFRDAAQSKRSFFGRSFVQEWSYGWSDDQGGPI